MKKALLAVTVAIAVLAALPALLVRELTTTSAATTNATMALNVKSGATSCDGPAGQPTKCNVPLSGEFTLSVDVVDAPTAGHIGMGTQVFYGDLTYKPTTAATDEIVVTPNCGYPGIAIRSNDTTNQKVSHGMTAGFPPTFTQCFYEGNVVELSINCSSTNSAHQVELLPFTETNTLGSAFKTDLATTVPAKILNSPLTINCSPPPTPTNTPTPASTPTPTKLPPKGDTDGDGCTDQQENGPNEMFGGRRNYLNPWDFYDTDGNKLIDLFIDIFNVSNAFGDDADNDPPGEPDSYDPTLDRSPPLFGGDPWDMRAPDGVIDLFTDVFGVANQFGHDCT